MVLCFFRLKLRRSGSIEVEGVSTMFESEPVLNGGGTGAMNPWVRKCLKDYVTNITTRLEEQQQPLSILYNIWLVNMVQYMYYVSRPQ